MIVSPFTPLFFINRKTDGIDSEYVQTFATTDNILLEIFGNKEYKINAQVIDECRGSILYEISFNKWEMNESVCLYFHSITLSPGLYSVNIEGYGKSETFRVTDDERVLRKTTLIQYANLTNCQRNDVVFLIDGIQYFFDFRVPGGFKDSNWTFGVENEQFVTDKSDIVQLFAMDSTQRKFTLGTSQGCPIWFAEQLNRLLCCTYVYFDGVRYARKETAVPEINVQLEGLNSFVFTQNLQQVNNIDPTIENNNQAIIRRIDSTLYRISTTNINRLIH